MRERNGLGWLVVKIRDYNYNCNSFEIVFPTLEKSKGQDHHIDSFSKISKPYAV